ncbi:hypothetical protein EDB19DRAFT_353109 [Suillus lakei]|nr:hypothetical protein EDB19DRAFT_353109 [Suillus lakei]
MDPYNHPQPPWGYYAMPSQHMHQQPHPQHGPHAAPPHQPGPLPMSPHPAAPQLPHTATMAHAIQNTPHTPQSSPSISSQPSTPSTANAPRFITNVRGFKVTIKSQDGMELTLDALKNRTLQPPTVPTPPASHIVTNRRRPSVSARIESEEMKRACEENARREQEKKEHAKNEAIRKKTKKEKTKKRKEKEGATRNEEDVAEHKRKAEEPSGFRMGTFQSPGSMLTSEERFAMPNSRSTSTSSATAQSCTPMASSQGGPGHPMHGSNRTRSKRGEKRTKALIESQQGQGSAIGVAPILGAGFEPVVPLELSANCCIPASTASKVHHDIDPLELIVSKVKALLNKLTTEKFESISDQIIHWANKSVNEKDGGTLIQVIRLVFERATDEPAWSEMHARLCQKMMEQISPEVQDDGIKNSDDKPIVGGQLFRKYLLNQSQEDFERGWFAKEVIAAAAAAKASDDQATKTAHQKMGMEGAELYFDECYAAEQVHRQRLGLIKFIGELFKLQMLTERVMHDCVETLLDNTENPEEEEIEILCQLLKMVGELLDTPKAHAHMDVYFTRMKELGKSLNVSPRMQFMLQDVFELRDRRWVGRNVAAAPTTLAAVYEAAAYRLIRISRGRRPMGGEPDEEQDSWAVASSSVPLAPPKLIDLSQSPKEVIELRDRKWVSQNAVAGGSSVSPAPPEAGDLSVFGKITPMAMTVRPSSIFMAGKKDSKAFSRTNLSSNMFYMLSQNLERAAEASTKTLSRTNSSSDMFHMLSQDLDFAAEASTKPSRSSSRRPSVDLGYAGVPESTAQRRKPRLLPRSVLAAEENATTPSEEQSESPPTVMSEADIKKQIDEDVNEFFAVRNLQEADVYLADLPHVHRFRLLDKLVASALESKETDARLVGDFFAQAASNEQRTLSLSAFEQGFVPMAEILDDIAIDAPTAFDYMAVMLRRCWIRE